MLEHVPAPPLHEIKKRQSITVAQLQRGKEKRGSAVDKPSEKFHPASLLRRASSFDLERAIEKAKLTGRIESTQVYFEFIEKVTF